MLMDGLQHLHSQQILYYSFKPANFVFDEYFNLKFVDFSEARTFNQKDELDELPVSYLPTEILDGSELPSLQSDLWGLGILLFELATGKLPFVGNTALELIESIANTKILSIPSYSIEFNSFINGLLRRKSKEKFDWNDIADHKWNVTHLFASNTNRMQDLTGEKNPEEDLAVQRRKTENDLLISKLETLSTVSGKTGETKYYKSNSVYEPPNQFRFAEKSFPIAQNTSKSPINEKTGQKAQEKKNYTGNQSESQDLRVPIKKPNTNTSPQSQLKSQRNKIDTNFTKMPPPNLKLNPLPLKLPNRDAESTKRNKKSVVINQYKPPKKPTTTKTNKVNLVSKLPAKKKTDTTKNRKSTSVNKNNFSSLTSSLTPDRNPEEKNENELYLPQFLILENTISLADKRSEYSQNESTYQRAQSRGYNRNHYDRSVTPEINRQPKTSIANQLKTRPELSPFQSLNPKWKKSTKHFESSFKALSMDLMENRELTSVIMNDSIQQISLDVMNNQTLNQVYDQFLGSDKSLEKYLCEIEKIVTNKTTENQKLAILYHLCRNIGDEFLTNYIAESSTMEFFINQVRIVKTKNLKIALSTLVGLVLRYATSINPTVCEPQRISALTEQFSDQDDTVKQRAVAAFGELLFYSITQTETTTNDQEQCIANSLKFGYPFLIKLMKTCKDSISLAYVSKTIENIVAKAPFNSQMFANEECVIALIDMFETQNDSYLKATCLRALECIFQRTENLTVLLKNKKICEICCLLIFEKDNELSLAALSFLTLVSLTSPDNILEMMEQFWQKNFKKVSDLILTKDLLLRNSVCRFLLVIITKDCFTFSNLISVSSFMANVESCIVDLTKMDEDIQNRIRNQYPSDEELEEALIMNKKLLRFICELCVFLVSFLLSNISATILHFQSLPYLKKDVAKSTGILNQELQFDSSLKINKEMLESFLRLLSIILTFDFMFELLTDDHIESIFEMFEKVSLLIFYCSENIVDSIFNIVNKLYKKEERIQRILPIISSSIYSKMVATFKSETIEEAKLVKFKILADMFIIFFVENHSFLPSRQIHKVAKLFIENLNNPSNKVSIMAILVFRKLLEIGIVTKNDVDLQIIVKSIFDSLQTTGFESLNQNFFKCVYYIVKINKDLVIQLFNNKFINIAIDYFKKYLHSDCLDEVIESVEGFFQAFNEKATNKQFSEKLCVDRKDLVEVIHLAVSFIKKGMTSASTTHSLINLIEQCLILGFDVGKNQEIEWDGEFNLDKIEFVYVLQLKDKLTLNEKEIISRIKNFLDSY